MSGYTDMLKKIQGADSAGGGGVYFEQGVYKVRVNDAFFLTSRKGKDLFIAEFTILESNNANRGPGMVASWCANLTDHDPAPAAVKAFLQTVLGITGEPSSEVLNAIVERENPLKAKVCNLTVTTITTRSNRPFSKHLFSEAVEGVHMTPAPAPAAEEASAPAPEAVWAIHPTSDAFAWNKETNQVLLMAEYDALGLPPLAAA